MVEVEKIESPSLGLGEEVDEFFFQLLIRYDTGENPNPKGPDLLERFDGRTLGAVQGILFSAVVAGECNANLVKLACPEDKKTHGGSYLWGLAQEIEAEILAFGPLTEPEILASVKELGLNWGQIGWNAPSINCYLKRQEKEKEKKEEKPKDGWGRIFKFSPAAKGEETNLKKWMKAYFLKSSSVLEDGEELPPKGKKPETPAEPTIEQQIEKLEAQKAEAVAAENYDEAKKLFARIVELKNQTPEKPETPAEPTIEQQIEKLEAQKAEAVAAENYDEAKKLFARIVELKNQTPEKPATPVPPAFHGDKDKGSLQLTQVTPAILAAAKMACDPRRSHGVKGAFTRAFNQFQQGLITEEAFVGRLLKEGWEPPAAPKK